MTKIHTIHTSRLILRTPQIRDAAAYVHMNTNNENQAFDPSPPDKEGLAHTVEKFETDIPKWREATEKGEAAFMVVTLPGRGDSSDAYLDLLRRKELEGPDGEIIDDTVIGMTGFNALKKRTRSLADGSTEALHAIVNYGFTTMGCDALIANTLVENKPFRALMKSLGAGEGKEVRGRDRWGKTVAEALYELERKE
jgi:RimJ/RimL family protein N-acetyltransferase